MQVEHIARVGLTSRRTTEQQRDFAVSNGLLREVVVDDQRIAARVAEILADGSTGERSVELHCCGVGGGGGHNNGVGHSALLLKVLHQVGNRRALLSASHINAVYRVTGVVEILLVDDSIDGDGGLARLTVAYDKLTLAPSDGNHRVDSLDACLQRLLDRLAEDDAGSLALDGHIEQLALDGTLAVDRFADGVDDAAHKLLANLDRGDAFGALHRVALVDGVAIGKHHHTHVVLLKVLHDALLAGGKLYKLTALGVVQTINTRNAVAHGEHLAHLLERNVEVDICKLFLQYRRYFGRFYLGHI